MIPLSGKNRSREQIAAAEALASFEDFRRQELDVAAKTKASYFRLANLYVLLELNQQDEAALAQTLEASRAKFEAGTQSQASFLTADVERQKIIEARRDLEQKLSDEQTTLKVLLNWIRLPPWDDRYRRDNCGQIFRRNVSAGLPWKTVQRFDRHRPQ
jgi:outer membrane protein TolC